MVIPMALKTAAGKQQMLAPQTRSGRRPLRVETLLKKDNEGKLWKGLSAYMKDATKYASMRFELSGWFKLAAEEKLKKPPTSGQPDVRAPSPQDIKDEIARRLPNLVKKGGYGDAIVKHLKNHDHAYDVAGLGVLGAIGADRLQAHARAGKGATEHQIEKKQVLGETGHALLDTAGLGILAAPVIAHMRH